ncbi:MAG: hypothetical protein OEQ29_20805 [Alphaproteobacteria bacterium]|nr:hypothetical protein [Alphaproteobacteria bacterium]
MNGRWTICVAAFVFVYTPSRLPQSGMADLVSDVSTAIARVWFVSPAVAGYFARPPRARSHRTDPV